jgi:hypothetical protein
LALVVPLSRFTSQVGGGSAFFVRHHSHHTKYEDHITGGSMLLQFAFGRLRLVILQGLQVHIIGGDDQEFSL